MDHDSQQSSESSQLPATLQPLPQSSAPAASATPAPSTPSYVPPTANGTTSAAAKPFEGQYDGPLPQSVAPLDPNGTCVQPRKAPYRGPNPADAPSPWGGWDDSLLAAALGGVPFVGNFLDGVQIGTDLKKGDTGAAAADTTITAASFIPGVNALRTMVNLAFSEGGPSTEPNPDSDTGLTREQERVMYRRGAQSVDPNAK
jgi:hypothetical protein